MRSLWREPRAPNPPAPKPWDWGLIFVVAMTAILEGTLRADVTLRWLAILVGVAFAVTLLWRRSHPLMVVTLAFTAITISNLVTLVGGYEPFGLYTMGFILLLPYALFRWGSGREIVVGSTMIFVGFSTSIVADYTGLGEAVAGFVFAISPALIGATVRYRSYARSRDRDQAALREREQLARELHDTVAHHVSAIAIQAQAGRTLAESEPNAPLRALQIIEAEASKTLEEMRAMVGALRQGDEPELAPIPGLSDVPGLVGGGGKPPTVEVDLSGNLDSVAPAVNAAVFRLAQESITNARRHARNASVVKVSVKGDSRFIQLTVQDDGDPMSKNQVAEPGFGLIGMGERAKLLGGDLEAGPGSARGWTVTAVLPKDGISR